jgi:hypothetical protein
MTHDKKKKVLRTYSKAITKTGSTTGARPDLPLRASKLRSQTRKLLGKHYRAKYGVR